MKIIQQLVAHFYDRLTPDDIEHIITKGLISEYYRKQSTDAHSDQNQEPYENENTPSARDRIYQSSRYLRSNYSDISDCSPYTRKICKRKLSKARRCFDKAIIAEQI